MKIFIDGMLFRFTGTGRIYENLLDGLTQAHLYIFRRIARQ